MRISCGVGVEHMAKSVTTGNKNALNFFEPKLLHTPADFIVLELSGEFEGQVC